ncbi:beta-galactosidase [Parabacteroides sp. PF5-5]|uniref:glycoside hydrolase family 2 TIM barrel-domain containing protein n=1 Tax=unclassified Parabacteroides TaxID=2649774 RepID=UPI00247538C4|nr:MULTISPECIES: glycoside hydrolase family 2 TIM barrel-domain containing protein [unclassified Parabacteroides]MDH6306926.1 beta-galactosidase [Parabacteroides sp. PH5-39]MDH6317813.1 beta-galactosidase [Parabacteroides sp. PF5-13]MDH6321531.1 beta-galactosidase [Parabacteroides sp. PH5-13]MDH6325313.1 beta-galactosidase [Parabacteroides sp. PH5-8]MDH6328984.1 beta-galactosidase [Parabacteroides sp. PH5-41]
MKTALRLLFVFAVVSVQLSAQQPNFFNNLYDYIENTSVFELNQEEGRAYFIPEKNLSLNGEWQFFYSDTPEGIPSDFYKPSFYDRAWETIAVPSNWEMLGYGDKLFRNVHAPFKANPPYVPKEYNPSGAYLKSFVLPDSWKEEQVFLRFEKVASASFVWVNGQEVGYNEGGQEPAEYNITKYLKSGRNKIAVLVLKYSDGYYLEGQDYWRLAGIFDDVWVYATPAVRLFDWQVITDLDESYTDAELKVKLDIKQYADFPASDYLIRAQLTDSKEEIISGFESKPFSIEAGKVQVELSKHISQPLKWTSETPNLYTLHMQLLTAAGDLIDQADTRIGFKETEIRDGVFYLNGLPVKVNAQNSHMQHPELGHVMNEATIRKDFEILKQFNFNTVRTSHYPPVNRYLELADEYGLYVIDEAGVEAHATEFVSNLPEFTEMYRERVRKMVLRDRNHPCILFWSAGNESGEGFNITEVVKEGRKYDETRYWMYGGNAFAHPAEDIIGPRYPTPMELEMQVGISPDEDELRPSFMDEYLSVAGNGGGGMDDYWRVIYAHPRTMGGAIWDFVSTGVTERIRAIQDRSSYNTPVHLMGNASLVAGTTGNVLDLNGHDQWVEVYRAPNVEVTGDKLTLTCDIYPRKLISSCGSLITKGSYQFGLQQRGKDSLEFYIFTDKAYKVKTALPQNWEYNWHQLTAVYDGEYISIWLDGAEKARSKASGLIKNMPYPVNIGRNPEIHGQETDVYICDAQFDNVGIFSEALKPNEIQPGNARLWLDFEQETDMGRFYSYGIGARTYGSIWPDRSVQPEMWQMKKSVQPISAQWVDAEKGYVEVWNRNHFLNASHYNTQWFITENGAIIQKGNLALDIPPLTKKIVQVPFKKSAAVAGAEYLLMISSSLKEDELWAHAGHEVAWDQLALPWHKAEEAKQHSNRKAVLHQTAKEIKVTGNGFSYTFDRQSGLLLSILYGDKEMLKAPLMLNVWRAPLANELDEWNSYNAVSDKWKAGYGHYVVTEFYSAGIDSLKHVPLSVEAFETDGKVYLNVRDIYLTGSSTMEKKDLYIWGMQSNGFENIYTYVIDGDGELSIHHKVSPEGKMPLWLPRIGLTLTLDKSLEQVEWNGRGPQENYPDRKTGYKVDIYQSTVSNMYEPYLIPQDYGLRTDNRWVKMTDKDGQGIQFKMNERFNFNAHPYSSENLTKAMYTYQLQEQDGITLNLDYATSGVGCTARSILNAYRVLPQVYERTLKISPTKR